MDCSERHKTHEVGKRFTAELDQIRNEKNGKKLVLLIDEAQLLIAGDAFLFAASKGGGVKMSLKYFLQHLSLEQLSNRSVFITNTPRKSILQILMIGFP